MGRMVVGNVLVVNSKIVVFSISVSKGTGVLVEISTSEDFVTKEERQTAL